MKTNMLKASLLALAAVTTLATVSCRKGCTDPTAMNYDSKAKKDDGSCIAPPPTQNVVKSGFITANETWTADNCYELAGKVVVNDGVTLTIEPGTIIKGREGLGTLASALVIARGGKIMANGTASQPIIFTTILDNIECGQTSGTNLGASDVGDWGGVIILGRAPVSVGNGDTEGQIEGIPVTDAFGAYGGNNAADNSGVLNYVSIRHGGTTIGEGNEINGLTLGGVGNGTTITNIEVLANSDDGVEFFGGTVNASNILVAHQGDDAIDIDQNYAGTVDNFLVIGNGTGDEALEIDGPEGSTHITGLFTLSNGTVTAGSNNGRGDFKSKAQGTITNVKMGEIKVRASYNEGDCSAKEDALSHLTDANPTLVFTSMEFTAINVYTPYACPTAADQTAAEGLVTSSSAAGHTANFDWTQSKTLGLF